MNVDFGFRQGILNYVYLSIFAVFLYKIKNSESIT